MMRRLHLLVLLPAACAAPGGTMPSKPNIVILLADDLGWADVSYHGGNVRTPNLDRLAREGVELDRFYVYPVCSPTRAGLMTGRYPIRYGLARAVIPPWRNFGLDTSEVTLADMLAKAGYRRRGIFGKWHLGHHQAKWHPLARGFTLFYGHYNGAIDYFTHVREKERDWHVDYEPREEEGYTTDLIADAAARFIEESAKAGPFLCYVPFNAPHSPFQAPEKYLEQYGHLEDRIERTLAAMITCMDDGIGRILDAIDRAGIRENTLVWFFSDNGGIARVKKNNLPLRGDKGTVFEGGIRVPASVRWPAGLAGGRKVGAPLANVDILPTLMRIAGVSTHGGKAIDGIDAFDVLAGNTGEIPREYFAYIGQQGPETEQLAILTPEWKFILIGPDASRNDPSSGRHERLLFRIGEDPYEKRDVSSSHPKVVERLSARLVEFRKLQPTDGVPPYAGGRRGFTAPKDWRIRRN